MERRRSERRRAADRLQAERENPHSRAENSRRVITVISLILIALFAYLLGKYSS